MSEEEQFESLDPLDRGDIIEIKFECDDNLTHPIRVRSVIQVDSGEGSLLRLEDSRYKFLQQVDGNIRLVTKEETMPVSKIIRRENTVPEPQTQLSN